MLTKTKSECDAQFLKCPPLACQIIFFEKKFTSLSKMSFNSFNSSRHTVSKMKHE